MREASAPKITPTDGGSDKPDEELFYDPKDWRRWWRAKTLKFVIGSISRSI
jgi:hypothetical protein